MAEPPLTTATLADMKARIADELARSDLTSQIGLAIMDAIAFFQSERFAFNESRNILFNTVPGQEFYTGTDNPAIPLIFAADYLILYLGSIPWPVHRKQPIDIELYNQNGLMEGQPIMYCIFNQSIRLGPVPDQVYQLRLSAQVTFPAPATDDEANNFWMTSAEKMIRTRAKWEIAMNVTYDDGLAQRMAPQFQEAYDQLKGATNRLVGTGRTRPMQF
jgi:hypothetical protein